MNPSYTIYGSPISLFTRKLEAAMQCYGVPFAMMRKTDGLRDTIEQRAATHQIPVLETPEGWMLGDTTPIIQLLDSRFPKRRLFPFGPMGVLVHIIEEVLDEWVARTMVHYRWHYDENARVVASELVGRELTIDEARAIPLAQWGLRACRATGTESESQQKAAEDEYIAILGALQKQLASSAFSLGEQPSAVDTIIIGSLRGHTNRDPIPDLSSFDTVLKWEADIANFSPPAGEWARFPITTTFVNHMLEIARANYKPFILGNKRGIENGDKTFVVSTYDEPVSYLCRAYPERSRRMIVDRIRHQLNDSDRALVVEWLKDMELDECFLA